MRNVQDRMRLITCSVLTLLMSAVTCFGQATDLSIAKDFAEQYTPSNGGPAQLKGISADVVLAFQNLRESDRSSCEKYLALMFIKLYRSHLECCNQPYELRTKPLGGIDKDADPLLFEFNSLTKLFDPSSSIELISSEMPFEWIKRNSHLRKVPSIKKELAIIKQKRSDIQHGKI